MDDGVCTSPFDICMQVRGILPTTQMYKMEQLFWQESLAADIIASHSAQSCRSAANTPANTACPHCLMFMGRDTLEADCKMEQATRSVSNMRAPSVEEQGAAVAPFHLAGNSMSSFSVPASSKAKARHCNRLPVSGIVNLSVSNTPISPIPSFQGSDSDHARSMSNGIHRQLVQSH